MTRRTGTADTRGQRSRLDDLITCCRDAANSYRAASRIPSAHRGQLRAISRRRSSFAHRLAHFSQAPSDANTLGSYVGRASLWLVGARATLLGQTHLGDSLAECLRSDATATRSYLRALDIGFNGDLARVLELQRVELEKSTAQVRTLRGRL